MATLTPEELQWLQAQLAAQNYGGIIGEANNRGITIGELSQLTGYSPEQINAYSDAQRAQQQIQGVTQPAPTSSPAQPAYQPPSFEAWFSSPEGQKMQTENGYLGAKAYYDQNIASGRWGVGQPTDPYKGESFAPVDINGQQFARTGMSFDEMMIDPMRRGFMQQAGLTANDFRLDPTQGWVTPFDKFHSQVELPIADAKKGNIFSDVFSMRGGLGPILAGMGLTSGLANGLQFLGANGFPGALNFLPEGYQGLLSSLGADMPWGVNPQTGFNDFAGGLAEDAGMSMNDWVAQQVAAGGGDLSSLFGGNGLDFLNGMSGAVGHAGSMTPEQLAAANNLGSTMTGAIGTAGAGAGLVGAGAALNAIGSGLKSVPGSNPTSGGNGTPNFLQTLFPNTGISDLLKGLIPAGLGAFGAKEQMDAFGKMQDKYLGLGAPYRDLLQKSYQPGFSMNNEPGYKDALDLSSQSVLRKLSAGSGNPFDQPNSMTSALDYVTKSTALPALQNYRGQLGNFGGLGVSQAVPFGQGEAQSSGGIFNALGFGLNNALNPTSDLERMLKGLGGRFSVDFSGSKF
jgi:hypothetical protein